MKTIVEYIWIGGNYELRSKAKVVDGPVNYVNDLSYWNYDGSSTNQAVREMSEVIIKPVALFNDPFRRNHHKLVLCDTYKPTGEPVNNNNRQWALSMFEQKKEEEPWFGLEQEYFLIDPKTGNPLGFPENGEGKQGQYYCSIGTENTFGREIVDEHLEACIYAGVTISGVNSEVAPGQWEFQIGPCVGIDEGDHMWMARYLLSRVAEKHNVIVNLEPKPIKGEWNGSGCHANYSTKKMREGNICCEFNNLITNSEFKNNDTNLKTHHCNFCITKNGLSYINDAIEKLREKHSEHMTLYGEGNEERMTGKYETASFDVFSVADVDRGCSIRRGSETIKNKKGYFEDRRPSSNCDPYLVTAKIYETTVL